MYSKGIAVIAITRVGVETALRIKSALSALELSCVVYAPKKYAREGVFPILQRLDEFIKDTYQAVDAVVAVMATGIIIRAVAPYLRGKFVDPAIVGVDANGRFVISLLSGHYGGANELTRLIAEGIGATAVVTTASDVLGKLGVDELARLLHLTVTNPDSLVAVNAALVNGERLSLVLVGDVALPADWVFGYTVENAADVRQAVEIVNRYDAAAVISEEPVLLEKVTKPTVVLRPKRIIVGVGARREISPAQILDAIEAALVQVNLPLGRVNGLATVDIKRGSQGMLDAAKELGLDFEFFSVDQLKNVGHEDLSPDSEMVKEKIGVGGVSERAAIIAAGKNSKLILKKQKYNGVTVAIAEGE